jgi:hypothetical protein
MHSVTPLKAPATFNAGDVVFVAVPLVDAKFVQTIRGDQICFPADSTQDADTNVWTWTPTTSDGYQWDKMYRSCNACDDWSEVPANSYQVARASIIYERRIRSVDGDKITFAEPLVQKVSDRYGGAWVFPAGNGESGMLPNEARVIGARAVHVGVEDIEFKSVYNVGEETSDEKHAWNAVTLDNVEDSYVREIRCQHLGFSCVFAMEGAIRITVDDAISVAPVSKISGGRRYARCSCF